MTRNNSPNYLRHRVPIYILGLRPMGLLLTLSPAKTLY